MPKKKPSYLLHKATGQARVRIDGQDHYLGGYGSSESQELYDDLIAEWLRNGDTSRYTLTTDDLCILFLEHAKRYYRKNGVQTNEVNAIRSALRSVVAGYGQTPARHFGPKRLKSARESMVKAGYCRSNINKRVERIRRMFRWAVENEYVPPDVYTALMAVSGLKRGRTEARESEPIKPVADAAIAATLPYLSRHVGTMVKLQFLAGARPGDICAIRPCDITFQTNGVWCYRPESHKTEHLGRERRIYIGPEAQEILRPFLERAPETHCFSPIEAEAERNAERREHRTTPMTPSQAARRPKTDRKRALRRSYTSDSYRRAVERACEIAFEMPAELRSPQVTAEG